MALEENSFFLPRKIFAIWPEQIELFIKKNIYFKNGVGLVEGHESQFYK